MSNVRKMRDAFPGSEWKAAFVRALMVLRPDINPDAADEISDTQFLTVQAMEPEIAAHHWVASAVPVRTDDSRSA